MNEGKGSEQEIKQRGGRKNRSPWGRKPMVSSEVWKWAKEQSGIGKETSKAGYYHKKY